MGRRKMACRSGMPCGLVNTSAPASGWVKVSRCALVSATIRDGIETVRLLDDPRHAMAPTEQTLPRPFRTVLL
jgi:hypothetical protein